MKKALIVLVLAFLALISNAETMEFSIFAKAFGKEVGLGNHEFETPEASNGWITANFSENLVTIYCDGKASTYKLKKIITKNTSYNTYQYYYTAENYTSHKLCTIQIHGQYGGYESVVLYGHGTALKYCVKSSKH
ncbi:MAG: hypothetical protein Q4E41_00145 [Bacteroidales bacterium]|nr:hypothetical protein [Bacteroidales bacterium]